MLTRTTVTDQKAVIALYNKSRESSKEFAATRDDKAHLMRVSQQRAVMFYYDGNQVLPVWADVITGAQHEIVQLFAAMQFRNRIMEKMPDTSPRMVPFVDSCQVDFCSTKGGFTREVYPVKWTPKQSTAWFYLFTVLHAGPRREGSV